MKMPDDYWREAKAVFPDAILAQPLLLHMVESAFYMGVNANMTFITELCASGMSDQERIAALEKFDKRIDQIKDEMVKDRREAQ